MVNNEYVDKSGYWFKYFELIRKSDNKVVYSCPAYLYSCSEHLLEDNNTLDFWKISKTLNFYFERINSGIQQQLESPRLTEEQKKELKLITPDDYLVGLTQCEPPGYAHQYYWKEEANKWLKY